MKTFHRLVANTLVAMVTNNFVWFALTFWVYLETRSVIATSVIGGGYMLLLAVSGMFFGTFVDRHQRKTSMLLSSGLSFAGYLVATLVYVSAPEGSLQNLAHPSFWLFITPVLAGAIAGNLRAVALSTYFTAANTRTSDGSRPLARAAEASSLLTRATLAESLSSA